ncbi:hypothetical protein FRC02_010980 [Tulasnella sp. 418]|nr:hypothetical protein FRC02_010980 [Tulasnella sp. 418]
MMNSTLLADSIILPVVTPFYYSSKESLLPGISDKILSLLTPIVAYWSYSLFFHFLDSYSTAPWLAFLQVERYRIHESEETKAKNKVTPAEVVRAVIVQHIIQTALGYFWIGEDDEETLRGVNHAQKMGELAPYVVKACTLLLGDVTGARLIKAYGGSLVYLAYWWLIPIAQFLLAFFIIDTWQYFLHRLFHVNKFLYKHFHSWHHRLYVPYSYGALYNHPFEGFLLDSVGAVVAEYLSSLTVRQACFLFGFSTLKTVDDHCGFAFPWDPFQILYSNNARYHDIHHRNFGLKYNFSQPFYIHWDIILGTRWEKGPTPLPSEEKSSHQKQE